MHAEHRTRSRTRTRAAIVGLTLAATLAPARDATLDVTSGSYQFIGRAAVVTDGTLFEDDFNLFQTPPFPRTDYAFSRTANAASSRAASSVFIRQQSLFTDDAIHHEHESLVILSGQSSLGTGSARSIFGVAFTIDEPTPYRLALDITDPPADISQWSLDLALNGPGSTQPVSLSIADFNPGDPAYVFTGTLAPGDYGISFVTRMSDTRPVDPRLSERFIASLAFQIPAPATLPLLALAALTRRRRDHSNSQNASQR